MTRWLLAVLVVTVAGAADLTPDDFVTASGPTSPRVAYALQHAADHLSVFVEAAAWSAEHPDVAIELAALVGKPYPAVQSSGKAAVAGGMRFEFRLPVAGLTEADLNGVRLAFAVRWLGGVGGADLQRERFRCLDPRAPHAPLPADPALWQPLSLTEYEREVADRRLKLGIELAQPFDGKATVVLEDETGRRVRNLLGGEPMAKGSHRLAWDGLDDEGHVVAPGNYRWRAAVHPGISPQYLFSFCNGPGSNHSTFESATTNGKLVFLGAPVTEGGYCMVALQPDGSFVRGFNPLAGQGLYAIALAADDTYLYAAHDGPFWGEHIDKDKADWKASYQLSVERFSLESGAAVDYPGGKRFVVLGNTEVGPGSAEKRPDRVALAGMVLSGGKLYVADGQRDRLLTVDAATGQTGATLPCPHPTALAAGAGSLWVASGKSVARLDPAGATPAVTLATGEVEPSGLWVTSDRLLVSDAVSQTVKVLGLDGKLQRTVGRPGGAYAGFYDPLRMVQPTGLTVGPNGWLWVAERNRWAPKRLAAYDLASGEVRRELFGPTAYGAPGSSFDPLDATRWIGQGALWKLDFAQKTARPQSILQPDAFRPLHSRFVRAGGRTFLIALHDATSIHELRPDGTLKALAVISSAHRYCFDLDWKPAAAFVEAFNKAYPDRKGKESEKGPGFLWLDRNGDGAMQADEIEFAKGVDNFAGGFWGHDQVDLTLRVPATIQGHTRLVTLKPDGWLPGGAPNYPSLTAACAAGVPIDLDGNEVETCTDRFGTTIANSDPLMKAFTPDGRLKWTYPNRWSNVHGSHNAPLPRTGELQGVLFFTGMAPLDAESDVMVLTGNHGRLFAMTSDGLYLDEMFKDCRLGGANDVYMVGGEAFGGYFGRSEPDGNYYLQAGGIEYRLFRVDGLKQVRRLAGKVTVTPGQAIAAERELARRVAASSPPKIATVVRRAGPQAEWPAEAAIRWDKDGRFGVTTHLGYDAANLYLDYEVADDSPWVNRGKDWQMLFKTGDSIDLQLGTNARAPADRTAPVPGDERLLLAPFGDGNVAVLYRHRLAQPAPAESVVFQCPWRSEKVDSVRRLDSAVIKVTRQGGGYRVTASIPLAALGLSGAAGQTLRGDVGVIYGDRDGTVNLLRNYWSNQATMLVNDVPGEIMLTPRLWGTLRFEEGTR